MNARNRARRYKNEFWPELEQDLKKWIIEERTKGRKVSTVIIRVKAAEMANQRKIAEFKGSSQWCARFMKRHHLSVRATTSVGQKLPIDWEEKLASFKLFVDNKKAGIEAQHIENMDEVPVSFDMVGNHTIDNKGAKEVKITSTGHEKSNFTVILCATADGANAHHLLFLKKNYAQRRVPKRSCCESKS